MSDTPVELDLKFLPDWLKESPAGNRYADYQGDTGDRPRREGGERRGGPPRNDRGPRRDGPSARPGGPGGPGGSGADRRGPRRDGPPARGGQRGERAGGARGDRRFDQRREPEREPRPPAVATAPVRIEFIPEPHGLAGITRQIKSGSRAYPLFGTARLFLEKPERHRVRITSQDPSLPLFQCGDGPVSFDRAAVERGAFHALRDEYYKEEVIEGEPLKGNFGNVARCRATGSLLGPTNYHAYQPALRKLYEERFSRRMSFPDFQQYEIEILTDEQAIATWKEQARSTTTYVTLKEAEPLTFKSAFDAEQHFRRVYLPQVIKSAVSLETSGPASRATNDRGISASLRDAWEQEKQFPQNLVNLLRPAFQEAGLHYFKHRKRMLFVSPIRPQRAPKGQLFSNDIAAILSTVEATPKCTRRDLAVKILGEAHEAPEAVPRKAALAGDLHYLVQAGHVIEFHDGTLDLPLAPGEKPENERPEKPEKGKSRAPQPPAAPAEGTASPSEDAPLSETSDQVLPDAVGGERTEGGEAPLSEGEVSPQIEAHLEASLVDGNAQELPDAEVPPEAAAPLAVEEILPTPSAPESGAENPASPAPGA